MTLLLMIGILVLGRMCAAIVEAFRRKQKPNPTARKENMFGNALIAIKRPFISRIKKKF